MTEHSTKFFTIILNCFFFFVGLAGIMMALMSAMLFDAPGSEKNPYVWILFATTLALPVSCLISCVTSLYVYFREKNYRKAFMLSLIPTIVIVCMVIDVTVIQLFCHGNFSCS